jgi:hypothetical protein
LKVLKGGNVVATLGQSRSQKEAGTQIVRISRNLLPEFLQLLVGWSAHHSHS